MSPSISELDDLTPRQQTLLGLVIREYIHNPQRSGVSSKTLAERYALDISSATIRNEMAALTELGYLRQPHTSAGRVPTEEGYRFFVSRLVTHHQTLQPEEMRQISHQFHQARGEGVDHWSRLAASVLARHTHAVSLATPPVVEQPSFRHLELISTRDTQVLVVLVFEGGEVRQRMITLDEPVDQRRLSELSSHLNQVLGGCALDALADVASHLQDDMARFVLRHITQVLEERRAELGTSLVRDGVGHLLVGDQEMAQPATWQTLRIFEERTFLQEFLDTSLAPKPGGIQVMIGGEGTWEELRDLSVVLTRYGVSDIATGAIGVIGPTHMAYGRAISTVRYVASLLTEMVYNTYAS